MSEGSPTEAFGPYLVYEQLGIGGMAQVHRAVVANAELPRPVALKRMLSHIAGSEEMVKSFVREARLASYLRHENVAQTYDLGRVDDIYFIVMELITGRNLREVLRHCGATTGPMPVPVALNILNQVCDALDYAHNLCDETGAPLGIIHRDVSPSNVIVSDSGVVKLIDFGIAKASGAGMQTMGGTLKGKFGYMAPEYIAGRIDARADLFAVGVIAHELLTNRPLFSGRDDIDTLTRVRDMHLEPPSRKNPQVPPEIDDIVMTALQRDPERRWQHATALRSALTTLTHRLGLVATNAQVIQWLDWAFAQHKKRVKPGHDTEPDPDPMLVESDEPSISIEPRTVEIGSISKKATLVMSDADGPTSGDGVDTRPIKPRSSGLDSAPRGDAPAAPPVAPRAPRELGANGVAPAGARSSQPMPRSAAPSSPPASAPRARSPSGSPPSGHPHAPAAPAPAYAHAPSSHAQSPSRRAHAPSSPPPVAPAPRVHASGAPSSAGPAASPAHRTHPASVPPQVAVQTARAHAPSTPPPVAARALPASALPPLAGQVPMSSAPLPVQVPTSSAPLPVVPGLNAAPFAAPRPSALGSAQLPFDPVRSAAVQREFAERTAMIPETALSPGSAKAGAGGASRALAVILVILAAAVAATTVYFVLPLLT